MKRFVAKLEGWLFPRKKAPRITYCTIPKEVWMADLKKAADYSCRFPLNPVGASIPIHDRKSKLWADEAQLPT